MQAFSTFYIGHRQYWANLVRVARICPELREYKKCQDCAKSIFVELREYFSRVARKYFPHNLSIARMGSRVARKYEYNKSGAVHNFIDMSYMYRNFIANGFLYV